MHFEEDKIKSIPFFNAKRLKEIISFAGHCIKQHNAIEYLGFS